MKKVFIAGMAMVVASTMVSNAFAAGAVAAKPKSIIAVEKGEKAAMDKAFGKDRTAKDVPKEQIDTTIKTLGEWIKPGMGPELTSTLKSDPSRLTERMDTVALIFATKEMGKKIEQSDTAEGKSLQEAAESSLDVIAVSNVGKGQKAKNLSAEDNTAGDKAVAKLETETPSQIKNYSRAERDSWTAVKKEYALTVRTAKFDSRSEALVQAIMSKVTNGDRAKAIEILRKLADCV
ncbi:hypothetical protein D3C72_859590 [compost metagenome]